SRCDATVAALATHMDEAELQQLSRYGSCLAALAKISASLPVNPIFFKWGMLGRSCGGKTPWGMPSESISRIFFRPCRTASRGLLGLSPWEIEARFPDDKPE